MEVTWCTSARIKAFQDIELMFQVEDELMTYYGYWKLLLTDWLYGCFYGNNITNVKLHNLLAPGNWHARNKVDYLPIPDNFLAKY